MQGCSSEGSWRSGLEGWTGATPKCLRDRAGGFGLRRTGGKRLFTVAPIHHGLQLKGGIFSPGTSPWHEATIVVRAWIVAGVCAIAGLSLMKVR